MISVYFQMCKNTFINQLIYCVNNKHKTIDHPTLRVKNIALENKSLM